MVIVGEVICMEEMFMIKSIIFFEKLKHGFFEFDSERKTIVKKVYQIYYWTQTKIGFYSVWYFQFPSYNIFYEKRKNEENN